MPKFLSPEPVTIAFMFIHVFPFRRLLACGMLMLGLLGCSPRYDWRDVRGADAPYTVLMPARPATHSRAVNIGGTQVMMTMTATEVDGVMFAVGTAEFPDPQQAIKALHAMKAALVSNIGGTLVHEKLSPTVNPFGLVIEFEATGNAAPGGGSGSRLLFGHLVASQHRVYQAIVLGGEKSLARDTVDTFLSSFKLL
jgi:hypothetical protein